MTRQLVNTAMEFSYSKEPDDKFINTCMTLTKFLKTKPELNSKNITRRRRKYSRGIVGLGIVSDRQVEWKWKNNLYVLK